MEKKAIVNYKTIWAMFSEKDFSDRWRVEDTRDIRKISFEDESEITVLEKPVKGTVIEKNNGIAIYMGDVTYLAGDISIKAI